MTTTSLESSFGKINDLDVFGTVLLRKKGTNILSKNSLQFTGQGEGRITYFLVIFLIKDESFYVLSLSCHMPKTGNQQTQPGESNKSATERGKEQGKRRGLPLVLLLLCY